MIQSTRNTISIPSIGEADGYEEFLREVIERTTVDLDFRARLIENPRQTLAEEYEGGSYDEHLDLQFVENDGADLKIVLPDPVAESVDLSETELEQVAGGVTNDVEGFTDGCSSFSCDSCASCGPSTEPST